MASHNLDRQPDELLVTEIRDLKRQISELRTLQQQGSDALRLGVVEGYLIAGLNLPGSYLSDFVDIAAPEESTIMVGSLVTTTFLTVSGFGPGFPISISNWDNQNASNLRLTTNRWMTYSQAIPDPNAAYDIPSVQAWKVADNVIRIGARTNRRGVVPASPTLGLYVFYQLRVTMN